MRGFLECSLATLPITIPLALGALKLLSNGVPYRLSDLWGIVPAFVGFTFLVTGCALDAVKVGCVDKKEPLRDPSRYVRGLYIGGPKWAFAILLGLAGVAIPFAIIAVLVAAAVKYLFH